MTHIIAYSRSAKPRILTKCGEVVEREDAVAFARQGADCDACLAPGAWPSSGQQKLVGFTAPGGHVFDRLVR